MNILELFCGSKSISVEAKAMGWQTFTSDFMAEYNPDYCADIMEFDVAKVPFKPDVIWASPPCQRFSVAAIGKNWTREHVAKNPEAEQAVLVVAKAIEIINHFAPAGWYIENPVGKLRKLPVMEGLHRKTVTFANTGILE